MQENKLLKKITFLLYNYRKIENLKIQQGIQQ